MPTRRAVHIPRPSALISAGEAEETSKRLDLGLHLASDYGLLSSSEIDTWTDSIAISAKTEGEVLTHLEQIMHQRAPDGFLGKALTPVTARVMLLREEIMTPGQTGQLVVTCGFDEERGVRGDHQPQF